MAKCGVCGKKVEVEYLERFYLRCECGNMKAGQQIAKVVSDFESEVGYEGKPLAQEKRKGLILGTLIELSIQLGDIEHFVPESTYSDLCNHIQQAREFAEGL